MKIGIYGGSFNPPHMAHLVIAELMREQFGLDQILWIPAYIPPHKQHLTLADSAHRLAMVKLATAGNPHFSVSSIEIEREDTSYTIDTIRYLKASQPDDEFYLIMGEDSLANFMSWRDPESIVLEANLLVYKRPVSNTSTLPPAALTHFPGQIHFASAPLLEISSSAIRKRRQNQQSIRYLVPESVLAYIQANQLYI